MIDFVLIISSLLIFFIVQVTINREIPLTLIAIAMTVFVLSRSNNIEGETFLFIIGLLLGLVIEVALGLILRTQHWEKASFFGVPYWLPIIWGYGFVMIHRVGNIVLEWMH